MEAVNDHIVIIDPPAEVIMTNMTAALIQCMTRTGNGCRRRPAGTRNVGSRDGFSCSGIMYSGDPL
jgi:hypothetical protein